MGFIVDDKRVWEVLINGVPALCPAHNILWEESPFLRHCSWATSEYNEHIALYWKKVRECKENRGDVFDTADRDDVCLVKIRLVGEANIESLHHIRKTDSRQNQTPHAILRLVIAGFFGLARLGESYFTGEMFHGRSMLGQRQ